MKIAVVIPCYRVISHILSVLRAIGPEVERIYVVDDGCPESSGNYVLEHSQDLRITVIHNPENLGVGGAVTAGFRRALEDDMDIVVKIDGDGQMDPRLIQKFIQPIINGSADYTKGSRFYSLDTLAAMPALRKFGNAVFSLVNKVSSGYWNIMDPANGYLAIHRRALSFLPLDKLNNGYFFESDLLFRLGTIRAVVRDVPMNSKYEDEKSHLSIMKVMITFPFLYIRAFFKRVFYIYFLRDFNGATLELILGMMLLLFGSSWGAYYWLRSILENQVATTGTVMVSVLPIILGFQLLLSAIHFDMTNIPRTPLQNMDL